jgi:hypothetical protein
MATTCHLRTMAGASALLTAGLLFSGMSGAAPPTAPASSHTSQDQYDLKKSAPSSAAHGQARPPGPSASPPSYSNGASSSYERNRGMHQPTQTHSPTTNPVMPHPGGAGGPGGTGFRGPQGPVQHAPQSFNAPRAPINNTLPSPAGFNPRGPVPVTHPVNSVNQGRAAPSSFSFSARPIPATHEQLRMSNGSTITTRSNGARAEIHDAHRGLDIHYGLNGRRSVVLERSDHSRVFAEHGGGYVQHPYVFRGQEFAHRTYLEHGHEVVRFYDRRPYHGVTLEVYAPVRLYPVRFYGWVYEPWPTPVRFVWDWRGTPWYRYYGYYFVPYPVYAEAPLWLTDYLIASSLEAAYAAQVRAQMGMGGAPMLSPEVKEEIAEEVRLEVQQERAQAQANANDPRGGPDYGGIGDLLTDGHAHVFMSGSSLDLVDGSGNECTLTQGDVVQVRAAPALGAQAVNATVVASKGGNECAPETTVRMALADLQDMQNYMRQTVDDGMAQLQARQGTGNLPAAPAGGVVSAGFVQGAPPADPNAQAEIAEQAAAADVAEREDTVANAQ